jgi:hypothetical protein
MPRQSGLEMVVIAFQLIRPLTGPNALEVHFSTPRFLCPYLSHPFAHNALLRAPYRTCHKFAGWAVSAALRAWSSLNVTYARTCSLPQGMVQHCDLTSHHQSGHKEESHI